LRASTWWYCYNDSCFEEAESPDSARARIIRSYVMERFLEQLSFSKFRGDLILKATRWQPPWPV
jgi:hypothetical protein